MTSAKSKERNTSLLNMMYRRQKKGAHHVKDKYASNSEKDTLDYLAELEEECEDVDTTH